MASPAAPRAERVAAVIPTKDAMPLLRACLDSVAWCDEIVVVDMFSTDGTVELCRQYAQCRVIQRDGYIFENFNVGMDAATAEWIIRLDSDEALTSELGRELQGILARPDPGVAGYFAPVELYFFGEQVRGGFARSKRHIMFRRGAARYSVRSEHEAMDITGRWLTCNGAYVHRTNPTVGSWLKKLDYYCDRDVERLTDPRLPSVLRGLYVSTRMFFRMWLRLGCWKDGYAGFVTSWMMAFMLLLLDAKIWEAWKARAGTASPVASR